MECSMKKICFVLLTLLSKSIFAQSNLDSHVDYFSQTTPGDSAVVFAPGIVSLSNRLEHAGVLSRNGNEFYFSVVSENWDTLKTYVKKNNNGNWAADELASFSAISGGAAEIFIDRQNTNVIFVVNGLANTSDGWLKTDFWIAKKVDDQWGTPHKLGTALNDIEVQWHPTISDSGNLYFGSKGFIYRAHRIDDTTYSEPCKFDDPAINLKGSRNAEPCIAADESFLIFSSDRTGGYGNNDLYITFKKNNTSWTNPKNLGPKINSEGSDFSPSITPDGKFLLFAKDNRVTRDIYWVSTGFIEKLMKD
jgi:hypothetical protein